MSKKMANEKVQVLVTVPRPDGYSKRAVVDYVRTAVHSHAGGFLEDSMVGEAHKATAKEHKGEVSVPEPVAPTLTTVQVLNEVVRGINSIVHMPPVDIRQNRREFWKAGARACLQMLNKSLTESADALLGVKRPQPIDGELFNYWVEEAGRNPSRVARALADCRVPDDYRATLWALIKEDEEQMTGTKPVLNPEGGLV